MWNEKIETSILYEDEEILVCHKPAGIAVQSARISSMDMESALKNYLSRKNPDSTVYLGIVHRLDQPVEGAVVFAKTARAAKELSRQMTAGQMGKFYLAVTDKEPLKEQGILEDFLKKDGRTNTSSVVGANTAGAKKARLFYEILEEKNGHYLLKIQLETGRHHQIRVQLAHAGMPLLGDRKYNKNAGNAGKAENAGKAGSAGSAGKAENAGNVGNSENVPLALCSARLNFCHPLTKKKMEFEVLPQGAAFQDFKHTLEHSV